jgi:glycerol-3-phosphate dehydrogenase
MVHGGLRYLAQGEISLVREAASERRVLNAIAPHLAQPASFILPSKNSATTAKLKAALWTFDRLGGVSTADQHQFLTRTELSEFEPLYRTEFLHGAFAYREYLTDDARLTLANIRSARAHGAVVANYFRARRVTGGIIPEVIAISTLDNIGAECRIRARVVVNAAGPWVDDVRRAEDTLANDRLALSKGVHIVIPHEKAAVSHTTIINTPDKRAIFAVPRGAFTYIGTTDGFYPSNDYWPRVDRNDVAYLLDATKSALHTDAIAERDVISVWAGIRPLIRQKGKSANEISRKDEIWVGPEGMLSIAGGKLSAYRAMAQRIVDRISVSRKFSTKPCSTGKEPLPGGEAAAQEDNALRNLGAVSSERLLRLYGTEAHIIAASGGDVAAEARQAVLVEGAMRLEDYWVRRSGRAWFDEKSGLDALAPAAREMAIHLGWNEERQLREIEHCREIDRTSKASLIE